MTQDLIAQTVGVRRETVNEVTNPLARVGIIRHARGCIEVLDRKRLESTCCECYGVIRREYARRLP